MAKAVGEGSKEERLKIATRIAELSDRPLSKKENRGYIALKDGDGSYSNVVTVGLDTDKASFHIPSSDLERQAAAADFNPEDRHAGRPFFKHERFFSKLTLAKLQKHEPLFRAIVKDSLEYVLSQRSKKK